MNLLLHTIHLWNRANKIYAIYEMLKNKNIIMKWRKNMKKVIIKPESSAQGAKPAILVENENANPDTVEVIFEKTQSCLDEDIQKTLKNPENIAKIEEANKKIVEAFGITEEHKED